MSPSLLAQHNMVIAMLNKLGMDHRRVRSVQFNFHVEEPSTMTVERTLDDQEVGDLQTVLTTYVLEAREVKE